MVPQKGCLILDYHITQACPVSNPCSVVGKDGMRQVDILCFRKESLIKVLRAVLDDGMSILLISQFEVEIEEVEGG